MPGSSPGMTELGAGACMMTRFAMLVLGVSVLATITAHAQDRPIGLSTPSKNIACQFFTDNGQGVLRCEIMNLETRPLRRGHLQMGDDGSDLPVGHIGITVGEDHSVPLVTRQHPLHRPRPAHELPLARRLAHVRLEAVLQAPVVGEFGRLGIDASLKAGEIGGT
jgi:hypothetical protein